MLVHKPQRRLVKINDYYLVLESENPKEDMDKFDKMCDKVTKGIEGVLSADH